MADEDDLRGGAEELAGESELDGEELAGEAEPAGEEPRGFAFEQMLACPSCLRPNPPTRLNCLYCGARLPVKESDAELLRPSLRPLEEWECGFNVILLPSGSRGADARSLAGAAAFLRLEAGRLNEMVATRHVLPLARVATGEEAALIVDRLKAHGLAAEVLADDVLGATNEPPRRVRALELSETHLTAPEGVGHGRLSVAWPEVVLIVAGRTFTRRVEVEERRTLTGGSRFADARETAADVAVIELFFNVEGAASREGWRIAAEGFDYSCLSADKGLLARDNFVKLVKLLRGRAARAAFDEEYGRLRQLLAAAWPLAEHTASGGFRRDRPGRLNPQAVTTVSNEAQFTRYARLCRVFEQRRRGLSA